MYGIREELSEAEDQVISWKERALKAEAKVEQFEWIAFIARDIVDTWPKLTFRMIRSMCTTMDTLKEALEKVGQ